MLTLQRIQMHRIIRFRLCDVSAYDASSYPNIATPESTIRRLPLHRDASGNIASPLPATRRGINTSQRIRILRDIDRWIATPRATTRRPKGRSRWRGVFPLDLAQAGRRLSCRRRDFRRRRAGERTARCLLRESECLRARRAAWRNSGADSLPSRCPLWWTVGGVSGWAVRARIPEAWVGNSGPIRAQERPGELRIAPGEGVRVGAGRRASAHREFSMPTWAAPVSPGIASLVADYVE